MLDKMCIRQLGFDEFDLEKRESGLEIDISEDSTLVMRRSIVLVVLTP